MAQTSLKVTLLTGLLPAFILMAPALHAAEPGAVNNAVVQQEVQSSTSKYNPVSWFKRTFSRSKDQSADIKQVAHEQQAAPQQSSQKVFVKRPTLGRRASGYGPIQQVSNQPRIITSTPAPFDNAVQARPISHGHFKDHKHYKAAQPMPSMAGMNVLPGYPQLGAPMYPSPKPGIPDYVGRTIITNQAFSPHEMLYPHEYNAMYGPYFYNVKGGWIWTPFGMRSHERWELEGTRVNVKYKSDFGFFPKFIPPMVR
ncbi:hypothetical protein V6x_01020 [Gimesia chilikensis]|uniref:Uncharacterized protein n=1 Tax=Gimesia chilikensis TaxID=2605989 RepID=A0A517W5A5_9PLAN|nr:hypothetical protein [Gimesia chilikensis]QDU00429.1 hypothetical protein V6x_01020 [Gimesia chilikensis]